MYHDACPLVGRFVDFPQVLDLGIAEAEGLRGVSVASRP